MNEKNLTHEQLAKLILENLGGEENLVSYMSCMTRLRVEVSDKSKVNVEKLKTLDKVKGVQMTGTICQVILFAELDKTYQEFDKIAKVRSGGQSKAKRSILDLILNFCSSVFTPLIPALLACGLLQGIVAAVDYFALLDATSSTYQLLDLISDTVLYYYPVFIAYSAAKYLKSNPYLTVIIALVMVNPLFLGLVTQTTEAGLNYFSFFGLPVRAATYTSTVFPMLCAIWGEYFVEKLVYKYIPEVLKTALAPLIVIAIATPICLCVLAPIGAFLNDGFSVFFTWFYHQAPVLAGLVLGGLAPFFVILGIHSINIILAFANLSAFGYDVIWPILFMNNIVVGAVTVAFALKMKNKEDKAYALTSGFTAMILGITEPSLYGVIIKNKKAIVSLVFAGAVVGVYDMVIGVKATAVGASGVFGIPVFLLTPLAFAIGVCIAIAGGFVFTYLVDMFKAKKVN